LTSKTLKIAGWLAMTSAFLALPLVYISFKLEGRIDLHAVVIQSIIQITGTLLTVAILLYLKRFLNLIYNFRSIDRNIDLINIASVVTAVFSIAALYVTPFKESIAPIVIALLALQGMVQVQLGYKLLKLPNDLGGILKPFCYAVMATGILLASVFLIPLAILASALSDLMLGTIFLNVSRLQKNSVLKPK
jgi:hypothetical protein